MNATRPALRGTSAAPLLHLLLVASGLTMVTWLHQDDPDRMVQLWVSTLVGAGLGHGLARLRLRLWLVALIVVNALWMCPLSMAMLLQHAARPWDMVELFVLAFGPSALSAYLASGERGGLLAFWFPASLWMIAILDQSGDTTLSGPTSWVLLTALAALLLGFLRLQETRRITLWQAHASRRLAEPRPPIVLRREPLRHAAQLGWIGALAGATLGLTAWIAPHLWHQDQLPPETHAAQVAGTGPSASVASNDGPCCTADAFIEEPQSRVREYFSMLRPRATRAELTAPTECIVCSDDGVPILTRVPGAAVAAASTTWTGTGTASTATPSGASAGNAVPSLPLDPLAPTPPAAPATASPAASPPPLAITAQPPPRPAKPRAITPPIRVAHGAPGITWSTLIPPAPARATERSSGIDPFAWMLTLALVSVAVQLIARPLRRLVVLRHLRTPLWPETVDQRVSNLWQLMLIGLSDAGFRAAPGEPPQALARRVALAGMDTCATILERARHGVRVDADDLDAMETAARAAYQAARSRAGVLARAASWLRWSLVD